MRLSAYKTDRGYSAEAHRYEVLLDGVPLPDCMTADEEQGVAVVFMRDADGNLMHDGARMRTKARFGRVTIRRVA